VHGWPSHLDHSAILEINWQIGLSDIPPRPFYFYLL
jgi:hypothetical protein